jgi:hypothetical protein
MSPYRSEEWYKAVAMDYLINARERGLCLHKVTEEYFGNDKISNYFHHLCFVASFSSLLYRKGSACCTRCTVKQPWICCHSCNPSTLVLDPSDPSHIPKGQTKWKVKVADYNMQDNDVCLWEHLRNWRKTALVGQGHGSDMFFGPQRILSDQLITRIANLAHHQLSPDSRRSNIIECSVGVWRRDTFNCSNAPPTTLIK